MVRSLLAGSVNVDTRIDSVLGAVAQAFRMDAEETSRFMSKPIARLIAALPFLAGANRPERTAAEHLGAYVLSVRETRSLGYATTDDDGDVFDRLAPIARFDGGDPPIIRRGMALLAMVMVRDYARDASLDRMLGKHNPIGSGAWDYDALVAQLTGYIDAVDCPRMDEIMDSDAGTESWWDW